MRLASRAGLAELVRQSRGVGSPNSVHGSAACSVFHGSLFACSSHLLFLKKPIAVAAKLAEVSCEQVFQGSPAEPLTCASKATEVSVLSAGAVLEPSPLEFVGWL